MRSQEGDGACATCPSGRGECDAPAAVALPSLVGGRRRVLVSLAAGVVVLAATYTVLVEVSGSGALRRTLAQAHPAWLALAVGGQPIAYAGYAVGYRGVVRAEGGPRLDVLTALRVVVLGFGGHLLGGASAGGIAVSLWALRRAGESLRGAVKRAIAVATLEWLVLGAAAAGASLVLLAFGGSTVTPGMALGWLSTVSVAVALALVLTSPRVAGGRAVASTRSGVAAAVLRRGLGTALEATGLVRAIVAAPRRHAGAIGGFATYWTGDLLTLYGALRAFGVHVGAVSLLLAYATGYVVASAPLPLGAVGAAEGGLTAALAAVGVALAPAALGALLYRACTFWLPILPALAALPWLRRLTADLEAVAAARSDPIPDT